MYMQENKKDPSEMNPSNCGLCCVAIFVSSNAGMICIT